MPGRIFDKPSEYKSVAGVVSSVADQLQEKRASRRYALQKERTRKRQEAIAERRRPLPAEPKKEELVDFGFAAELEAVEREVAAEAAARVAEDAAMERGRAVRVEAKGVDDAMADFWDEDEDAAGSAEADVMAGFWDEDDDSSSEQGDAANGVDDYYAIADLNSSIYSWDLPEASPEGFGSAALEFEERLRGADNYGSQPKMGGKIPASIYALDDTPDVVAVARGDAEAIYDERGRRFGARK